MSATSSRVLGIVYLLLVPPTALTALAASIATIMGIAAEGGPTVQGSVLVLAGFAVMATPVALLVAAILLLAGRPHERPRTQRWGTWGPVPFLAVTAVVVVLVSTT
jgi:amino acid transporter